MGYAFRVKGLVRALRASRRALSDGFEPGERAPFLRRVQGVVEHADLLLDANEATPGCLPPPSRKALAELRRIADTAPEALPERRPDRPRYARARVKNVVAALGNVLDALAPESRHPDALAFSRDQVEVATKGIERVCEDQGSHPSRMPAPSRTAYAQMKWLTQGDNLEHYAAQVRRMHAAIEASRQAGNPSPMLAHAAHVVFRGTACRVSVDPVAGVAEWILGFGWLVAERRHLRALVEHLTGAPSAYAPTLELIDELQTSEAYRALHLELRHIEEPTPFDAVGRAYDLGRLFDRLDAQFFRGSLPRPNLHWQRSLGHRTFGLWVESLDLACVNPLLDDPRVPEFVAEVVLYHELLHKKHGTVRKAGRRHAHTRAFRAEERLHPRLEEADRWIEALAAGREAPAEPEPEPAPPARGGPVLAAPPGMPLTRLPGPRPGRNEPCHCGSGRKYKRCHLRTDEA